MPGTLPHRRAAIAVAFVAQALLILAIPVGLSTTSSSAYTGPVRVLPIASPPDAGITPGTDPFPVTVRLGPATTRLTYPVPGVTSLFLIEPGKDVTVTVTVTLTPDSTVPELSFSLDSKLPGNNAPGRDLLDVPTMPPSGSRTFTLHLGILPPHGDWYITMFISRPFDSNMDDGEIAEIATYFPPAAAAGPATSVPPSLGPNTSWPVHPGAS